MTEIRLDHLTRGAIGRLAPDATVVVPLGSTEQHGHHLPVCTDTAIVTEIAIRAARQVAESMPIVVAPALPYGFAHHHLPFGGTISIGMSTYLDVLTDVGASLHASGFRRLLFLNGHGGNDLVMRAVGDRLLFERGLDMVVAATSYWTCAAHELLALEDIFGGPVPGHAGGFETACLMSIAPELVDRDLIPEAEPEVQPVGVVADAHATIRSAGVWQRSDGRTDDARGATAEKGVQALDAIVQSVADFALGFR